MQTTDHLPVPRHVEAAGKVVVDAALKVHSSLGPGLLESAYKACLAQELALRGLSVRMEVPVPVVYEGLKLEAGFRIDLLVEECLVVEIKAIDAIHPVHLAQVLTYLQLSGHRLGFLLNFNVTLMKEGIRRLVR